jgi:hypothetical protein
MSWGPAPRNTWVSFLFPNLNLPLIFNSSSTIPGRGAGGLVACMQYTPEPQRGAEQGAAQWPSTHSAPHKCCGRELLRTLAGARAGVAFAHATYGTTRAVDSAGVGGGGWGVGCGWGRGVWCYAARNVDSVSRVHRPCSLGRSARDTRTQLQGAMRQLLSWRVVHVVHATSFRRVRGLFEVKHTLEVACRHTRTRVRGPGNPQGKRPTQPDRVPTRALPLCVRSSISARRA